MSDNNQTLKDQWLQDNIHWVKALGVLPTGASNPCVEITVMVQDIRDRMRENHVKRYGPLYDESVSGDR